MPMQYRTPGRLNRPLSAIGQGCWQIGADWGDVTDDSAQAVLGAALEAGVTFFDTADVYGDGRSERLVGQMRSAAVGGGAEAPFHRYQGLSPRRPLRPGDLHRGEPARLGGALPQEPRHGHPGPGAAALPAARDLPR